MSDENVPKLRLKPKLGAEATVASQASAAPVEPVPPVAAATESEAPKLVRLKPKLSSAPAQETAPAAPAPVDEPPPPPPPPVAEAPRPKPRLTAPPMKEATRPPMQISVPAPAPEAPPVPAPPPAPVAETPKPAFKLGLKPKGAAAAQPAGPVAGPVGPMPPPPGAEGPAPNLDAPPPPPPHPDGAETDTGENGEPAEITIMRKASSAPFTPPSKFPPPPGIKKSMPGAATEPGLPSSKGKGSRKKLMLMAGGGVAALVLLGAVFVALKKPTAEPPPPPRPKVAVAPVSAQGQAVEKTPEAVEQAGAQAEPPTEGTPAAAAKPGEEKPTEAKPEEPAVAATHEPEPKPVEEVKPVAPPPPPPPSIAFRGWVENLKIAGVRGGANPRVFIGKSSYLPGDLVNPQMGITFEGYNTETRMLSFKDNKTGARVERRH